MIEPVHQQIQNVEAALSSADDLPDDIDIRSHWAKYVCILVSASLEACLEAIFLDFAHRHSKSEYLYSYAEWHLLRHGNPNRENIIRLHNRFSEQWGDEVKKFIQGQKIDAIKSISDNRNSIAHGGEQIDPITIYDLRKWFEQIKEIIAFSHKLVLETGEEARAPRGGEGSGDI